MLAGGGSMRMLRLLLLVASAVVLSLLLLHYNGYWEEGTILAMRSESHWLGENGQLLPFFPSPSPTQLPPARLLCVWFTTFKTLPGRERIHLNTIKNWAKFLPHMQPVLFVTPESKQFKPIALEHGWHVFDVPRVNSYGTPYISEMVDVIMNGSDAKYDAIFYGFANGDILFDSSLHVTLSAVVRGMTSLPAAPVLLVGQRINVPMLSSYTGPLYEFYMVKQLADSGKGKLYRTDAEDYFFFTRDYQTDIFKNLVIGRPAYDNFLVSFSIKRGVSVIDATKTVTALHQTSLLETNNAGFMNVDVEHNNYVISNITKLTVLATGHTVNAQFFTFLDLLHMDIGIMQRRR